MSGPICTCTDYFRQLGWHVPGCPYYQMPVGVTMTHHTTSIAAAAWKDTRLVNPQLPSDPSRTNVIRSMDAVAMAMQAAGIKPGPQHS